jgi:hypothetical protein
MERLAEAGADATARSHLPRLQLELARCVEQVPRLLSGIRAAAPQGAAKE